MDLVGAIIRMDMTDFGFWSFRLFYANAECVFSVILLCVSYDCIVANDLMGHQVQSFQKSILWNMDPTIWRCM